LSCSFNTTWISNEARRPEIIPWSYESSKFKTQISRNFPFILVSESLTDEKVKNVRDNVEFILSVKTHFLNKLSLKVDCTRAYCTSCNALLQNRILPLTLTSRPTSHSRLQAQVFLLGSILEEIINLPPKSWSVTQPRPDGKFQSQVFFLVSTLEKLVRFTYQSLGL
jgi:hypothetical protein